MKKSINVVAAIIKKDNLYFCAQRPDRGELAKKWEFPGGKIESDESHEDALIREINEELDSIVKVKDYIMTVDHEYETFHLVMHCFLCELVEGALRNKEHINTAWLTIEEMYKYDFAEADKPIIEHLKLKYKE